MEIIETLKDFAEAQIRQSTRLAHIHASYGLSIADHE
jgi:hypothetical protein